MKIALISLIAIGGVVALVLIIGSLLPVKHTVSISQDYYVKPEDLWKTIRNFDGAISWRTGLKKVEKLSDTSWREHWSDGNILTLGIESEKAPTYMLIRMLDKDLPFGGVWAHEITEQNGISQLTITEKGEVYNPVYRFLSRFVFGHEIQNIPPKAI